jgi:uncharacterized membrane protein YfcA
VVFSVASVAVITEAILAPSNFHYSAALSIAIGGQVGAQLAGRSIQRVSDKFLRSAFLVLVLYAGLRNLGAFGEMPIEALPGLAGSSASLATFLSFTLGVLAGGCAVFFGVGGGIVVVPGLVFAVGGFPLREAMGTSLLAMVPTAALALRLAVRNSKVDADIVRALIPSALIGATGGVVLRNFVLAPKELAWAFGVFLLWVAFHLARPKQKSS